MGKWSQYRVKYQPEWEEEDGFRGDFLRPSCYIVVLVPCLLTGYAYCLAYIVNVVIDW